ncbi:MULTISPECIES: response regulator [unclassified Butyrivibrio]|uniref:response regulator transcription factor n=1 Tax=unclassified Butyrivibrio TaxID=2639466 RepID=UPI0003FB43F8|nr:MULTISPECIES: response regulator [unclassified Butyrivibrio]SDB19973.1 Helix-turn-helix domain-containing protein [Butyrivibrio sp. INlla16]SEL59544.1 Helix-turn-helix domain-containing protein [Butyrivibrio sp. ob235]
MNLLIIDDEYYIVQGLVGMINKEELGFDHIFTAYSAQQGMTILKKEQVDLMLLDIEMPKETGLELLEQLNVEGLQPTTIILSGHQRFDYAQEAMHYHCFNYLLKPIGKQNLNQELSRAMAFLRPKQVNPESEAGNGIKINDSSFVHTVRRYIRDHLSDADLNRVKIADAIHLNPDYLSFCFHKEFETTLTAYINSKRMDQAKYLLKNTTMSISDIAEQVGIPNTSYFYRQFKKTTGQTPQQYRK